MSGSGPDVVEAIGAFVTETCGQEEFREILVYGDRVNWRYKAVDDMFPGKILHVHDSYHRFKCIGMLGRLFPGQKVRGTRNRCLEENDCAYLTLRRPVTQTVDPIIPAYPLCIFSMECARRARRFQ